MKNIFKLFSLIMVLLVTMLACEEEAEWYGDYNGSGDVYAQFSDTDFDYGLFLDAEGTPVTESSFPIYVKLIGPAQKADVKVGIKITQSTGAAGEWTIPNKVATIAAGSLSGSVMINISKDLAALDSTYTITLAIDEATTDVPIYTSVASTAMVTVMKGLSCAFDYAMFDGAYYYKTIWDYDPNPASTVTPDATGKKLTISTIWDEMSPVVLPLKVGSEIGTNLYELSSANIVDAWSGSLESWGLGEDCDFNFEDINAGGAKSCTGEFSFASTPTLDDNTNGSSYWWGGEFVFEFIPGAPGKKSVTKVTPVGFTPKLQRIK
jgi:hypothetical protein